MLDLGHEPGRIGAQSGAAFFPAGDVFDEESRLDGFRNRALIGYPQFDPVVLVFVLHVDGRAERRGLDSVFKQVFQDVQAKLLVAQGIGRAVVRREVEA